MQDQAGQGKLLVVDDEAVIREGLRRILEEAGYQVDTFARGHLALECLQTETFDLVISDVKMPGMGGMEVLKSIRTLQPQVPIIMITGYSTVDTAVDALKNGAADYISKPFVPEDLLAKVDEALKHRAVLIDDICLRKELKDRQGFCGFIGTSPEMQKVYHRIIQVAGADSTVLVTGESGTGKELVARAIHQQGNRRDQPFVPLDCTALPDSLLESELFGHVRGSFTGAMQSKTGLLRLAEGGTLFLDEIANISLATQAKLLRVLQERVVLPIGGTQAVPIDIRLIGASNQDLRTLVQKNEFREDLYFRLNIIPVDLPPLRERKGDLRLLIGHFLRKFADASAKDIRGVEPEVIELLEAYAFPGNVRELENIIERAVVLAEGEFIGLEDLEMHIEKTSAATQGYSRVPQTADELKTAKQLLRERAVGPLERAFVLDALRRNSWNITRAAEAVGMLRPNFQALIKKQGISSRSHGDD